MSMLEVKDLHVSYGAIQAVQGVSFELNQAGWASLMFRKAAASLPV